jgi:hypothetical protein
MKPFFSCLILIVFACSCSGCYMSAQKAAAWEEQTRYCELLHVPSKPGGPLQPRPYLGVYLASKKIEQTVPGCKENVFIQVAGVIPGTPAEEAGLRENDMIISFNEDLTCTDDKNSVKNTPESFRRLIEKQAIGSTVKMDILRGTDKLSLTAKLREMPVRFRPEAEHETIGACHGNPSAMENALRSRNALQAFEEIIKDLDLRSNASHDPGVSSERKSDALQLGEVTYLMRHPLAAGAVANELSRRLAASIDNKDWRIGDLIRSSAHLLDIDLPPSDSHVDATFPELLRILELTKERTEKVLSALTKEERDLLLGKALNPWDDDQWNRIVAISLKTDRRELFLAFAPLLSFLSRENLSALKEDLVRRFGHIKKPILYEAVTPIGKVMVGGAGPNTYREDAALILDLGGDDLYLNNAGGTRPGVPVALVIDWGGNDRYISAENFSQGAGVLGAGILIDLGGDDTFVSLDGSQGTGLWGLGLLYHGDGNGIYKARTLSQGVGQMGLGIILNRAGDDIYLCSDQGQALGLFGGAGVLIDGAGRDFYQLGGVKPDFRDPAKATVSMGQGFGLGIRPKDGIRGVPGGIGILIDANGDDTYIADYFAQGAAYYYGLGILNDMSGDDRYMAGRYAQGAGIHSAVGVLVDHKGNDSYHASIGVAQALGHDYGVGFLEDDQGDDIYWGGSLVQGAATNGSLGIFMDLQGHDRLEFVEQGQAFAVEADSMGIMIKRGAADDSMGSDKDGTSLKLDRNERGKR